MQDSRATTSIQLLLITMLENMAQQTFIDGVEASAYFLQPFVSTVGSYYENEKLMSQSKTYEQFLENQLRN